MLESVSKVSGHATVDGKVEWKEETNDSINDKTDVASQFIIEKSDKAGGENMEDGDDHEGYLGGEEDGNDNDEHHGGAPGVSVVMRLVWCHPQIAGV